MNRKRISVSYRENCGGVLRSLASGLRKTVTSLAEVDLYEDLRERIFRKDATGEAEPKQKLSA
jgi:hypothetical protein